MIRMDDISYKVDTYIVSNGFYQADNAGKKKLIETGLRDYMIDKISEIYPRSRIPESKKDEVTLQELAGVLGEIIPAANHFDTLRHLTHYAMGISSFMQGWSAIWYVEDDPALIDTPLAEFNPNGKWDKLITHRETPYVKSFEFALENLDKVIALKDERDKQFVKQMKERSHKSSE